jgi:hypothetical protein
MLPGPPGKKLDHTRFRLRAVTVRTGGKIQKLRPDTGDWRRPQVLDFFGMPIVIEASRSARSKHTGGVNEALLQLGPEGAEARKNLDLLLKQQRQERRASSA